MNRGLRAARPHVAFLIGLSVALMVMWQVSAATSSADKPRMDLVSKLRLAKPPLPRKTTPLTAEQLSQAQVAWRYFENNYVPETGLVNSVDKYESTTMWDTGSYLMGLLAARDFGIVSPEVARQRVERMLASLAKLPLVEGLPNKAYNTRSLAMTNYDNSESKQGIGWSAIDIARLSVPLTIIVWRDPDLAKQVREVLRAWALDRLVAKGRLQGAVRRPDGRLELVQEGRIGYEQYAAQALVLLGVDVEDALRWDLTTGVTKASGQLVPYDTRLPEDYAGTHNAVVSEPFLLAAFEMGMTPTTQSLTQSLFLAQRNRAKELGKLVAVSEDNIDRPPYFVYNSIFNDRKAWVSFTPDGVDATAHRGLSTKAAFGWGLLFEDEYAARLRTGVAKTFDAQRGWYSGLYDADGKTNKAITANTNGIILEALWYQTRGPLIRAGQR
ncbi:MAG: DUF3131 domain-containing protein [Myxococcales bacterium]|nr:DUF3131 domain-containing protein [Myxococcales bacterium]